MSGGFYSVVNTLCLVNTEKIDTTYIYTIIIICSNYRTTNANRDRNTIFMGPL